MTAWLALPTFLCAVTWLPWILTAIKQRRPASIALFAGLTLLSGHLQIATYVLLAAMVFALWHNFQIPKSDRGKQLIGVVLGLIIAVCLAAPQILPSIELSRVSHRVATGSGFEQWRASSGTFFPLKSLVTLAFPDFFGNPTSVGDFNLSGNAFAEWAIYTGICPLFLAITAVVLKQFTPKMRTLWGFGTAHNPSRDGAGKFAALCPHPRIRQHC